MDQTILSQIYQQPQTMQYSSMYSLKKQIQKFTHQIRSQFDQIIRNLELQKSKISMFHHSQHYYQKPHDKRKKAHQSLIFKTNNKMTANQSISNSFNPQEQENKKWTLPLNSKHTNLKFKKSMGSNTQRNSYNLDLIERVVKNQTKLSPNRLETHQSTIRKDRKAKHTFNNSLSKFYEDEKELKKSLFTQNYQDSQYKRRSQIKKQREEQVIFCLQSQKKNLKDITSRIMTMIGKDNDQEQENDSFMNYKQEKANHQNQNSQLVQENLHNRSLSNICDSLDNSFVSQKTRKSKMKKKLIEQQTKKFNSEKEIKNEQIRKQKALKNLLSRLRQNALSVEAPETVKASKLLSTGTSNVFVSTKLQSADSGMPVRRNSKVLINPVPVSSGIGMRKENNSPSFIQKRPTSILKQSSNVLTRSISGISAIDFN